MAKYWDAKTEKLAISVGMGVTGYAVLAASFPQRLPTLPNFVMKEIAVGISLLTLAGLMTVYGIWVWNAKY